MNSKHYARVSRVPLPLNRPSDKCIALPPGLYEDAGTGGFRWKPNRQHRAQHASFVMRRADGTVETSRAAAIAIYERWLAGLALGAAPQNSERTLAALIAAFRAKVFDAVELSNSHRDARKREFAWLLDPQVCSITVAGRAVPLAAQHVETLAKEGRNDMMKLFRERQAPHTDRCRPGCKIHLGVDQGFKLFGCARMLFNFAREEGWCERNPLEQSKGKRADKMQQPKGRIEVWENDEIAAFIAVAHWLGYPSQAHFVLLALTTGLSVNQALKLTTFPKPIEVEGGAFFAFERDKTGVTCFPPASKLLVKTLADIGRHNDRLWPGRSTDRLLIWERTGKPYDYENWREINHLIRLLAGGDLASYNMSSRTEADPAAHRRRDRVPVLRKVKSLDELPCAPVPTLLLKKPSDLRDTALSRAVAATGKETVATLMAGHSTKLGTEGRRNHMLLDHYWRKTGGPVVEALGAWDDIYDVLNPERPRPRLVAGG